MKKFSEMTDKELNDVLKVLNSIDSNEIGGLSVEIHTEFDRRKQEAEKKRLEKLRLEEERKAEMEIKREKEREDLVQKQKSILGKCFMREHDGLEEYLKVNGVDDEFAIVTKIVVLKGKESLYDKTIGKHIRIDKLSKMKEISLKEFDRIEGGYTTSFKSFPKFDDIFNDILSTFKPIF